MEQYASCKRHLVRLNTRLIIINYHYSDNYNNGIVAISQRNSDFGVPPYSEGDYTPTSSVSSTR